MAECGFWNAFDGDGCLVRIPCLPATELHFLDERGVAREKKREFVGVLARFRVVFVAAFPVCVDFCNRAGNNVQFQMLAEQALVVQVCGRDVPDADHGVREMRKDYILNLRYLVQQQ
jgi:hypothetical protein